MLLSPQTLLANPKIPITIASYATSSSAIHLPKQTPDLFFQGQKSVNAKFPGLSAQQIGKFKQVQAQHKILMDALGNLREPSSEAEVSLTPLGRGLARSKSWLEQQFPKGRFYFSAIPQEEKSPFPGEAVKIFNWTLLAVKEFPPEQGFMSLGILSHELAHVLQRQNQELDPLPVWNIVAHQRTNHASKGLLAKLDESVKKENELLTLEQTAALARDIAKPLSRKQREAFMLSCYREMQAYQLQSANQARFSLQQEDPYEKGFHNLTHYYAHSHAAAAKAIGEMLTA